MGFEKKMKKIEFFFFFFFFLVLMEDEDCFSAMHFWSLALRPRGRCPGLRKILTNFGQKWTPFRSVCIPSANIENIHLFFKMSKSKKWKKKKKKFFFFFFLFFWITNYIFRSCIFAKNVG